MWLTVYHGVMLYQGHEPTAESIERSPNRCVFLKDNFFDEPESVVLHRSWLIWIGHRTC